MKLLKLIGLLIFTLIVLTPIGLAKGPGGGHGGGGIGGGHGFGHMGHIGVPPGWHHGRKVGWHGAGRPPGWFKHHRHHRFHHRHHRHHRWH